MSDARDLNKDGKVSLMEKVKDKLHLGHKDDAYDTTTTSTHHSTTSSTAHHSTSALPATSHTGYSQTSALPVTGAMPVTGMAAVPVAAVPMAAAPMAALPATTTGAGYGLDSRDLNRDGHVSMTEKLASGATGVHNTGSTAYTSGAGYDSRDLNGDGHISTSEKLRTGAMGTHTSTGTGFDSRDLNRDGHISTGERLAAGSSHLAGANLSEEEMRLRLHEEQLAISKREVGAGEVDIHKRVHEQHVQQTVPVRREEVIVERRPLSGVAEPGARIAPQDETMRVALFREEIVTEKRIVPTEEVIVRKKEVVDQQTVGATLRSEHVETVQTGTHSSSVVGGINESNIHGSTMGMNNTGAYNSKDLNNDGHVSLAEKAKSATTGAYNPAAGYDPKDINGDGRVTMGEKAKNATTGAYNPASGVHDSRDKNYDGHISMGEKLSSGASNMAAPKAARG
jgi:uncharacterized protein (TIGR02271 family)